MPRLTDSRLFRLTMLTLAVLAPAIVSMLASFSFEKSRFSTRTATKFDEGRKFFNDMTCSRCHTIDGSGQRSLGPPLNEIGKVGAERKPGMTAAEYILESILDPGAFRAPGATGGMPEGLVLRGKDVRHRDVRQLVGFLANRGATAGVDEIDRLSIPEVAKTSTADEDLDFRQVKLGEAIFRGKGQCTTCHSLRSGPGVNLTGPSLLNVGTLTADELREAIEKPSAKIAPGYQQAVAERADGRRIEGRLVEKTADGIYLLQTDSAKGLATVFVPFCEMEKPGEEGELPYVVSKTSIMPGMKGVLTSEEIDALVAFLRNRHGNF
jgi:putative heme-binding domain-containing protein